MGYRKITVYGIEYEYVVGRSNAKVKGVGAFGFIMGWTRPKDKVQITPSTIRQFILRQLPAYSYRVRYIARA